MSLFGYKIFMIYQKRVHILHTTHIRAERDGKKGKQILFQCHIEI